MKNLILTALVIALITIPLATSLLLQWSWIQEYMIRQIIVYIFISIEIIAMLLVIIQYLKSLQK